MEESYDQVRLFALPDDGYPLPCRSLHVLKRKARPKVFGEPHRNGRSNHAQHGYPHTFALQHNVGLEMGLTRRRIYHIGTQDRETAISGPTVEDCPPGLDVVVAHVAGIVIHEVQHLRRQVGRHRIHIIIVIGRGLPLEDIPIVQQQQIVPILLPLLPHVGLHPCQASRSRLPPDEVVGIEIAMHIRSFYNLQLDNFVLRDGSTP